MYLENFVNYRNPQIIYQSFELVVIGGGLTGVCCAITAAREGIDVCLIQDRPVLGGNASSEVRLWGLGATSHMGNNNRWAREGGIINEILVENMYRNKEGNPVLFDMVLMDKVLAEENITLYLNTVVYELKKESLSKIQLVKAYNSSSETLYEISGRYFADCSGDGIISYMAGVPFRMGAEDKEEYAEGFAPDKKKYGELMGHSILFYMKDTKKQVKFVTPDFALKDVEKYIPKVKNDEYFSIHHHGCKYWWIEYGGRLDTIHDTELIKKELWKVVYGIWGYIKNSGKFPEMDTYTLEWVGLIPGKRESRRFRGLYTLNQRDIIQQSQFYDAVSYGGWSIDLHPSDGVYANGKACNQWHSKGVYQIPLRCYMSSEINNLMFAGRIISVSHVANGSTRVMCTSALGGQAVGMTLALCIKNNLLPIDYVDKRRIGYLQKKLIAIGHFIPHIKVDFEDNLLKNAVINVSSCLQLAEIKGNNNFEILKNSVAQLLPISGKFPSISLNVIADKSTSLMVELRKSSQKGNYTPDEIIECKIVKLCEGKQFVKVNFSSVIDELQYVFICFKQNELVRLEYSNYMYSGITTVYNQVNIAVSNYGKQVPPKGIGVDTFEFWCPKRRPDQKNLALKFSHPIELYSIQNLLNSYYRPFISTNAWAAELDDISPTITINWETPQLISQISLFFDVDYDHAMETVQFEHFDNIMPQCVTYFDIFDGNGHLLQSCSNNYQAMRVLKLLMPIKTHKLILKFKKQSDFVPVSLLGIVVK